MTGPACASLDMTGLRESTMAWRSREKRRVEVEMQRRPRAMATCHTSPGEWQPPVASWDTNTHSEAGPQSACRWQLGRARCSLSSSPQHGFGICRRAFLSASSWCQRQCCDFVFQGRREQGWPRTQSAVMGEMSFRCGREVEARRAVGEADPPASQLPAQPCAHENQEGVQEETQVH